MDYHRLVRLNLIITDIESIKASDIIPVIMGRYIEDSGRPNLHTIPDYLTYSASWSANFRLDGVDRASATQLARVYIANQADGIMLDGTGQIGNICHHARIHHINPRKALEAVRSGIVRLGEKATIYQLQTMDNINVALSIMTNSC